jgi:orotate phosphoribosyltransferase
MNQTQVAEILVKTGCLALSPMEPFTYASGLKGPIYCDNRKIISHVEERRKIVDAFIKVIEKHDLTNTHFIAGLATGGIAHSAWIAEKMDKPMVYLRAKAKNHGRKNSIEGDYKEGQSALLIEDLVNQGSSLEAAVKGAREFGLVVEHCISIVDYKMDAAKRRLEKLNLNLISLTDLDAIVKMAQKKQGLTDEEVSLIYRWQDDPINW